MTDIFRNGYRVMGLSIDAMSIDEAVRGSHYPRKVFFLQAKPEFPDAQPEAARFPGVGLYEQSQLG